jgi:alpha-mannosidase
VRRIGHSEIVQDISLTAGSRLIEFDTRLRWRETASMLRALFPVNVRADEASYEIQFGRVRRPTHGNTAWDLAMDEVPAQRWADLSQPDYGVALLNDSKHAYRIKDGVMELNLLRSAPYSGPRLVRDEDVRPGEPHHAYSDQCDHAFRYALYPHPGDAAAAGVVRAGCEFNTPLRLAPAASRKGPCPARHSLLEVDAPNVVISWAKKPENGDGLAVRLYETEGAGANAVLRVGIPVRAAAATNLIEERPHRIRVSGGGRALRLRFRPFEIKTIRLSFRAGRAAGEILP